VSCYANLIFENKTISVFKPAGGSIVNFMDENAALGSCMFKKEDWLSCDGYDKEMRSGFEDWEFYIRILKNNGVAFIIKEPLFSYRKRSYSTTTIANNKKYELLKYIYLKHQDLYKNNFASFVTFLLSKIEREEHEKLKKLQIIEYKIGKALLSPLRKIKSIFK
jgi:hypothetical protein